MTQLLRDQILDRVPVRLVDEPKMHQLLRKRVRQVAGQHRTRQLPVHLVVHAQQQRHLQVGGAHHSLVAPLHRAHHGDDAARLRVHRLRRQRLDRRLGRHLGRRGARARRRERRQRVDAVLDVLQVLAQPLRVRQLLSITMLDLVRDLLKV